MTELEFETSSLWQTAFGHHTPDRHTTARVALKQKFFDLREKVALLVSQISSDIPNLTIHDITHLDALWETASLIAGPAFVINPAEAYVLGASILFHDAGMCLAAYPRGRADIYKTDEWRDTVAAMVQQAGEGECSEAVLTNPPDDIQKRALPEVLRLLHARKAKDLPVEEWRSQSGQSEPLIEDTNLRTFYGPVIGNIAYSHHIAVGQLEGLLGRPLGAYSGYPSDWTVDPVKIACLLRTADAAHIDERRAPRFLRTLLRPQGVSDVHWTFQGKLAKARVESDALVYTSGPLFELSDADAWWLCFDTVQMITNELSAVDILFESTNRQRLMARRVRGAESPTAFSAYVRSKGWVPVDTQLRVSDVPRLVRLFGGAHLYGDDVQIPLRELVQNSSDAIRARRLLEDRDEHYGTVTVSLRKEPDGYWLDVEDDGVGMSERTMTGPLLDFGKSFWTSDAIKMEFPGLVAKGMSATGKFGVGFFSIFMLGEVVRVTSRRYDAALITTKTLEFRSGLTARPILRDAYPTEILREVGTRISIKLKDDPYKDSGWLTKVVWPKESVRVSLCSVLSAMCPNLDAKIRVVEDNDVKICVAPQDWITMSGSDFLVRLGGFEGAARTQHDLNFYGQNLRALTASDGTPVGRACIWGSSRYSFTYQGCVTVGGLVATRLRGVGGILVGETQTIARDSAMPVVSAAALSEWADEQARLLAESALSEWEKMKAAAFVLLCGGNPGSLPVIKQGTEFLNTEELKAALSEAESIVIFEDEDIEYDEDSDQCHPKNFREWFEPDENMFFLGKDAPTVLKIGTQSWPECIIGPAFPDRPKSLYEHFRKVMTEIWGEDTSEFDYRETVGFVDSVPIERLVTRIYPTFFGEESHE